MNFTNKRIIRIIAILFISLFILESKDILYPKVTIINRPRTVYAGVELYDGQVGDYNDDESSVTDAYGYKISIVRYDGTNSPTRVGNPILIYHPSMMGTVQTQRGSLDGGSQFSLSAVDGDATAAGTFVGEGYPPDDGEGSESWNNGIYPDGGSGQGRYEVTEEGWNCPEGPEYNEPSCNSTGFFVFIFRFMTSKRLVTYDSAHMSYDDTYYAMHADSRLTQSNIETKAYLDDVVNQWAGNRYLIETNFGIKLNDMDMDKYYIQVDVVQRVLNDSFEDTGTFLGATENKETKPEPAAQYQFEHEWGSYDWESDIKSPYHAKSCDPSCRPSNKHSTTYKNERACRDNCPVKCSGTTCSYCSKTEKYCEKHAWFLDPNDSGFESAQYHGKINRKYKYGHYAYGSSEIVTSRNHGSGPEFLKRATNECNGDESKHCIRDNNTGACTDKFEYYVGASLEKAMVGPISVDPSDTRLRSKSYLFTMEGAGWNGAEYACTKPSTPKGVKFYYIPNMTSCIVDGCSTICNPNSMSGAALEQCRRSDNYLSCAENYCEAQIDYDLKGNATNRKRKCITSCGYGYGYEPYMKTGYNSITSKYRQSESSCMNTTIFKSVPQGSDYTFENYFTKSLDNVNSQCSKYNNAELGETSSKLSVCYGDTVTDFDDNDGNDTKFDVRTYVNVACQEVDKVSSITDVSFGSHKLGSPIDYSLNVRGTIKCVVFFNYEQWKVDYAYIPRRDTIRKNRLKYIYEKFNNLLVENYRTSSAITRFRAFDLSRTDVLDWDFELTDYGKFDWDDYDYEIDKVETYTDVNEVLKDSSVRKTNENPLKLTLSTITSSKNPIDLHTPTNNYYAYKNTSGKRLYYVENGVHQMTSSGNSDLQGYYYETNANLSYQFNKYCVDSNSNIKRVEEDTICENGTKGQNEYYISFSAKPDRNFKSQDKRKGDNFISHAKIDTSLPTNVEICTTASCSGTTPLPPKLSYKDEDYCPYKVDDLDEIIKDPDPDSDRFYCEIVCSSDTPGGNGNYFDDLTIEMKIYKDRALYNAKTKTLNIKSKYSNQTLNILKTPMVISRNNNTGVEKYKITGTFTDDNNDTHHCYDTCSLLKTTNCNIKKLSEDATYEVLPYGNSNFVGYLVSTKESADVEDVTQITPDFENKYKVNIKNLTPDSQYFVYGYAKNANGGKFCRLPEDIEKEKEFNCKKRFKPGQYDDEADSIEEYCEKYYKYDLNNYKDPEDCIKKCIPCPDGIKDVEMNADDVKTNIKVIKEDYCGNYWSENKYKSKEACIQLTYKMCVVSDRLLYRPVNVNNPFPSAVESSLGYVKGKRSIGVNWQGKSQFITETYVEKDTPDYYVVLDDSTVNAIKQKVRELETVGDDNIYGKQIFMSKADKTKKYYSRFIREEFVCAFDFIEGKKQNNGGCKYE